MKEIRDLIIGSPVVSILLVCLIVLLGFKLITFKSEELPGEAVPTISPQKISPGTKHPSYSTNPPSSGWYTESNLRDGIFTSSPTDEQIVEALTKGIVVISYNCMYKTESPTPPAPKTPSEETSSSPQLAQPEASERPRQTPEEVAAILAQIRQQNKLCGELTSGLRQIVEGKGVKNIILAPRGKLDTRIALAAWGRLDKFLWLDKERISRFIDAYRGKIPKL